MINIRNTKGDSITDSTDTKMIIMEYSEPYYTSQLDNLAKTDKFFERHKLSKLIQKEIGKIII